MTDLEGWRESLPAPADPLEAVQPSLDAMAGEREKVAARVQALEDWRAQHVDVTLDETKDSVAALSRGLNTRTGRLEGRTRSLEEQSACLTAMIVAVAQGAPISPLEGCPAGIVQCQPRGSEVACPDGTGVGAACAASCPAGQVLLAADGSVLDALPVCLSTGRWSDDGAASCGPPPTTTTTTTTLYRSKVFTGAACDHTVRGDSLHLDCPRCNQYIDGRALDGRT